MDDLPDISRLAATIGEPARARMLLAMLASNALTAGQLSAKARVTPQTASGHLKLMLDLGLLEVSQQGRRRHYRLANSGIGGLLEQLMAVAESLGIDRIRISPVDDELRRARTCYDHMAGEVAISLFERMKMCGFLLGEGSSLVLSEAGKTAFVDMGIPRDCLQERGRPVCVGCLDWREQKHHLAGRAGAALLQHFLAAQWAERNGRTLKFSAQGERALGTLFMDGPAAAAVCGD